MPRHSSDEIFYLIHSLSHSELTKLRENLANTPSSTIAKGQTPLYLQLIEYILGQDKYSDAAAKAHFGYKEVNSSGWRVLKKKAVDQAIRAMELAKENQNNYVKLHRIPVVLRQLVDRGIYELAEGMGVKYLNIAQETEQFHLVSELVEIMHLLVVSRYPHDKAIEKVQELQAIRRDANERLKNLQILQEIWYAASIEAKRSTSANPPNVEAILKEEIIANKDVKSAMAEMYFWKIQRRCYFLLKDYEKYKYALDSGIQFCEGKADLNRSEFFEFYMELLKDRGQQIELMAHRFKKSEYYEQKMIAALNRKSIAGKAHARAQAKIYRFQLSRNHLENDREGLQNTINLVSKWLLTNRGLLDTANSTRLHRMLATYNFFLGNFSEASKWIYPLRSKLESADVAFAWTFYLITRLESQDYEIVQRESKPTNKYFSETANGFLFFAKVADHVIGESKGKTKNAHSIELLKSDLMMDASYTKNCNYFPFFLWLDSRLTGAQLWDLVQQENKPKYEL